MPEEIVKLETRIASLDKMSGKDLSNKAKVDAIVSMAKDASQSEKDAKSNFDKVKDNIKRMCAAEMENGEKVTCYSYANESKISLVPSGGGASIDEEDVWNALCDAVGEAHDDHKGQAWAAWLEITKSVTTRYLDEEKLKKVLAAAPDGKFHIDQKMITSVSKEKKPTYKVTVSAISKAEKTAFDRGEAVSVKVVE